VSDEPTADFIVEEREESCDVRQEERTGWETVVFEIENDE
jgi:hypothetical protein